MERGTVSTLQNYFRLNITWNGFWFNEKRDTDLVSKLFLKFLRIKHQTESEKLKKMAEYGEDEEKWNVVDASAHVQPKRRVTFARRRFQARCRGWGVELLSWVWNMNPNYASNVYICQRRYAYKTGQRTHDWIGDVKYVRRRRRWRGCDSTTEPERLSRELQRRRKRRQCGGILLFLRWCQRLERRTISRTAQGTRLH